MQAVRSFEVFDESGNPYRAIEIYEEMVIPDRGQPHHVRRHTVGFKLEATDEVLTSPSEGVYQINGMGQLFREIDDFVQE